MKDTGGESIYLIVKWAMSIQGHDCSVLCCQIVRSYCIYAMKLVTHGIKTKIKAKYVTRAKLKRKLDD